MIAQRLGYYWRVVATALCFALFGVGGLLIPLLAAPWITLVSATTAERQERARRFIHQTFRVYIHMMRAFGVLTWEIKGAELLRRPGLLVLANHPCLIDVVFLIAFIPNPDCIVKGRLLDNPVMRGYLRLTGFLRNDDGAELIEGARASIGSGSALIIFPEGTRTQPGEPLHFQRGAANVAVRTQTPVTPVTIQCEPITLSKNHRWYHVPQRKVHMTLRVGADIPVSTYDQHHPALAARQLTQDLQKYFTGELRAHDKPSYR